VTADDIGRFAIRDLRPGLYRVEARTDEARGYHPIAPVRDGVTTIVTVRLRPVASISGQVITESGVPVPGATVTADLGGVLRQIQDAVGVAGLPLEGRLHAVTDPAGAFRIGDLPVGQYEIEVKARGYVPRRIPFVNAPVDHILIELLDTFTARGTVVWGAGRKVTSLRILAEPTGTTTPLTPGPASAAFAVIGLPRGPHTLRAIASDGGMATARVEIVAGRGNDNIIMDLLPGSRVRGRVRDDRDRWIPGPIEALRVERTDGGARLVSIATCVADQEGRFDLFLAHGDWVLKPGGDGLRSRTYDRVLRRRAGSSIGWVEEEVFTVRSDQTTRDLELVRIGLVAGRVRWAGGWPAVGAEVWIDNVCRTSTDGAGRYRLTGIPLDRKVRIGVGGQTKTMRLSSPLCSAECDFVLPRRHIGIVRGRVFSEESEPVPGVTVFFNDGFAVTDLDGRFERTDVSHERHELRFFAPGYALGIRSGLEVSAGVVTEVPLMVLPWHPRRANGRVTDPDGMPIAGARVRVFFPGLDRGMDTVTDAGGWFRQEGPGGTPGPVRLHVSADGHASRFLRLLPGVTTVNLPIELPVARGIRIRFTHAAEGLVLLRVRLRADVKLPRSSFEFTVRPGTESIDLPDLPPGKHRAYVFEGKHLIGSSDRFELRKDEFVEIGPYRLSR